MIQLAPIGAALLAFVGHHHRLAPAPPPMTTAVASWYEEHGTGACGVDDVQNGYRFASLILRCGDRVQFAHAGRTVIGTMADHGPYVTGRTFDLNANLRAALDCPDICWLMWRLAQ